MNASNLQSTPPMNTPTAKVFKHSYFKTLSSQRKLFLEADKHIYPTPTRQLSLLLAKFKRLHRSAIKSRGINIWAEGLKAVRPLLPLTLALNLVAAIASLVGVLCVKQVLERQSSISTAIVLCFVYLATEVLDNCVTGWMMERRNTLARSIQAHLLTLCNAKLLKLDRNDGSAISSGNLKTLISSDVESVEDFMTIAISMAIPAIFLLALMTPLIYHLLGWVGLAGIALALCQIPISIYFARYIEGSKRAAQTALDEVTTLVGEWVRHIRLIRYLGWQAPIKREISQLMKRVSRSYTAQVTLECGTYAVSNGWWTVPILGMLAIWSFFGDSISLGSFFASLWALAHVTTNSIQHIPFLISWYAPAAAGEKRLREFFQLKEMDRLLATETTPPISTEEIKAIHLSNVSLTIDDRKLINEISLSIAAGEKVAIVGEVGSGKSLLLDLICGERKPTSGVIEVEFESGARANLWSFQSYHSFRSRIAACWQVPYLSNNSLLRNIDLGDNASIEEVSQVISESQLENDLESFPKGLMEEVGEVGINLSGGQKQRVSIARAFLSNRRILILDDPLSAVDKATESALISSIFKRSSLLIMATHRLAEIRRFSRILVLDGGSLVEDAAPAVLIENEHSRYFRLHTAFTSEEQS